MEVACSKCGAKGRVPDERLASGPVSLRCSACQSVLRVGNPKTNPNGPAWFFDAGQGAQGPYRIDELIALWQAGRLGWDARLWREGDPEWAVARGHGPFIDAIFARDAGAPALADAFSGNAPALRGGASMAAARRDANALAQREPSDARFTEHGDRTDPQLTPPRHVPDGASETSITEPRNPDPRARVPHDSLAPFERASRVPGRRWPAAILIASSAIAACVVFWAVRAQPSGSPAVAATTVQRPSTGTTAAITPNAVLAREHADVEAAVAEAAPRAALVEQAETAVPAEPARAPALPVAPARTLPAAEARPLRSAGEQPRSATNRGIAPALRGGATVSAPASANAEQADDSDQADDSKPATPAPVANEDGDDEPSQPATPPPVAHAPDFLTSAAPLPDTPTTLQIASAMRAVAPAVRACADSMAPTTVYVSVAITGATGRVGHVSVPSVASTLERCVAQAVQNATFPRFDRPQLELRFPFLLGR